MSGAASLGALPPAGWACSEGGEIKNGQPQCKDDENYAVFKHSQSLEAEDVLRMKVVAGGTAWVGIAAEGYDVERDGETVDSTAYVMLSNGTTAIYSDISEDGKQHYHHGLLKDPGQASPTTWPFASTRTATCHSFGSTRTGGGTILHLKVGLD